MYNYKLVCVCVMLAMPLRGFSAITPDRLSQKELNQVLSQTYGVPNKGCLPEDPLGRNTEYVAVSEALPNGQTQTVIKPIQPGQFHYTFQDAGSLRKRTAPRSFQKTTGVQPPKQERVLALSPELNSVWKKSETPYLEAMRERNYDRKYRTVTVKETQENASMFSGGGMVNGDDTDSPATFAIIQQAIKDHLSTENPHRANAMVAKAPPQPVVKPLVENTGVLAFDQTFRHLVSNRSAIKQPQMSAGLNQANAFMQDTSKDIVQSLVRNGRIDQGTGEQAQELVGMMGSMGNLVVNAAKLAEQDHAGQRR